MQCIRCGAEVSPQGRMLVTGEGSYVCPASLSGEAAVHRVADRPPVLAKNRSWIAPAIRGVLGFAAGRMVGNLLVGGAPKPVQMQPFPPGTSPVEQAAAY